MCRMNRATASFPCGLAPRISHSPRHVQHQMSLSGIWTDFSSADPIDPQITARTIAIAVETAHASLDVPPVSAPLRY